MNEIETNDIPLFLQLLVFTDCTDFKPLSMQLSRLDLDCYLFKDLRDPQGIGVLAIAEDPEHIVSQLQEALSNRLLRVLMLRQELTMTARTHAAATPTRHELEAMLRNAEWPWAIWYPMRGTASLSDLDEKLQGPVFDRIVDTAGVDPAGFGRALLKSHGLDQHANEFVQGLLGPDLHQLSTVVEATRRSPLHSEYVAASGPFFVGRAIREGEIAGEGRARW